MDTACSAGPTKLKLEFIGSGGVAPANANRLRKGVCPVETIDLDRHGAVAIVRLDRPPVNAVNRQMMSELRDCFADLSEDRTVNAVVLSAAGEKAFCAGIDLREGSGGDQAHRSVADTLDSGRYWRDTQQCIRHCTVPVIAAVERAAIGAGFGLVGVCDLIVASETATFSLTEINVGLLGGAAKALRMLGPFKARMMLFSGEPLSPRSSTASAPWRRWSHRAKPTWRPSRSPNGFRRRAPLPCGWPRSRC